MRLNGLYEFNYLSGLQPIVIFMALTMMAMLMVGCSFSSVTEISEVERRSTSINKMLMCPVCPGESIDQSQNDLAINMKRIVEEQIAEGKTDKQIQNDYANLEKKYKQLITSAEKTTGPTLIHSDLEMTSSVLRDLINDNVEKIVVDSKNNFKKVQKIIKEDSLEIGDLIEHYKKRMPLFKEEKIDGELMKLLRKKVWLKSGAYLVIERTEAMVVVDVNSGKFVGNKGHEENSLKINLEAAKEIAKQLRLRHLSGLILIDFIDMTASDNRKKVYLEMKKELRKDRAKVAVSEISEFGVLEMNRERTGLSIVD